MLPFLFLFSFPGFAESGTPPTATHQAAVTSSQGGKGPQHRHANRWGRLLVGVEQALPPLLVRQKRHPVGKDPPGPEQCGEILLLRAWNHTAHPKLKKFVPFYLSKICLNACSSLTAGTPETMFLLFNRRLFKFVFNLLKNSFELQKLTLEESVGGSESV